jgi:hypothetical protein
MPKPVPPQSPDPMAGIVDRLLAQLPGLQGQPEPARPTPVRPVSYSGGGNSVRPLLISSERSVLGMWIRLFLALSLGVMMGWWPYARACGLPLAGYLAAVGTVIMAGTWAASASWAHRSGLAHTIALILVFYGMLLAGSELLPRTGYAVNQASWSCDDVSAPALVFSSAPGW